MQVAGSLPVSAGYRTIFLLCQLSETIAFKSQLSLGPLRQLYTEVTDVC